MGSHMAKSKQIILLFAAIILLVSILWIAWANTALEQNTYAVCFPDLPSAFDGYRIAHISDLHNTEIGERNEMLLQMLKDAEPDIIAITGDLIDSRRTDTEVALDFVKQAMEVAPCYYVTGNHESRIPQYEELKNAIEAAGVVVLEDAAVSITLGADQITLVGVNDPAFAENQLDDPTVAMTKKLEQLKTENGVTILLSHRPELFESYRASGMDLVLSGHAHGGQFRLPWIGGLVAPNQGFFPQYDSGLYTDETTNMIVSRGIGNSLFPFRFNNRPEVILIELQTA